MTFEENLATLKQAIHGKQLVKIKVDTREKGIIERKAVPYDYGPSRARGREGEMCFHFRNLDGPKGPHPFSAEKDDVLEIHLLDETFDPGEHIDWPSINWHIERDWGDYS